MTVLLAFLLVMGLPWVETNVTVTGRQSVLKCHVCEEYNTLTCTRERKCEADSTFCVTAVVRVFVRFFYMSRQCTMYCPIVKPADVLAKSFILLKPTSFLYASCCRTDLCNTDAPNITETEGNYKEAGRAGDLRGGSAGLVLFLTLTSVSLGLGLS